ncbi:deoxynucleoside monophosphate kinase [Carnobacterium phage cd4]|uniref:AAA family ATPase n=1 Tax=Carnobacterium phage cd4 TaxID=2849246 RepID=A0AAE7SWK1_9CAUD|nr:deoxynucleoside monophosphate kinase [Carnobacterium phage cd4]QXP45333.1 putative AAA family ATPase [Carnobacterium phage cd4]
MKANITEYDVLSGDYLTREAEFALNLQGKLDLDHVSKPQKLITYEDFPNFAGEIKIALIGKARSGKDTFANNLSHAMYELLDVPDYFNDSQYSFAEELKNIVGKLFPNVEKDREKLVAVGEFMRSLDPDVWVKQLEENYSEVKEFNFEEIQRTQGNAVPTLSIITDVRRENEAQWALDNGFTLIYVSAFEAYRQGRSSLQDIMQARPVDDEVDKVIETFDPLEVKNNGTEEELYAKAESLITMLLKEAMA